MKLKLQITITLIVIASYVCPTSSGSVLQKYDNHQEMDDSTLVQGSNTRKMFSESSIDENEVSIFNTLNAVSRLSLQLSLSDMAAINVSEKCAADLQYIFQNLGSEDLWAARMIDSYGKPEAGILQGNVNWLGDFDGCLSIHAPRNPNISSTGDFQGKYCKLSVTIILKNQSIPIGFGTCQPDSCSAFDLESYVKHLLNQKISLPIPQLPEDLNSIFTEISFFCQPNNISLTGAAIFVIFLISIFVLLAVIGSSISVYEILNKRQMEANAHTDANLQATEMSSSDEQMTKEQEVADVGKDRKIVTLPSWFEKSKPFFNCFCFITNGAKLLDMSSTEGQLPCLHGIRFFSMSWIISCHTYSFSMGSVRIGGNLISHIDAFFFQIIQNGYYAVDSFFLLSGFLLAYLYFQQAPKTDGKIPWLYFYVHRYLRLTPVYMMAIAFYTNLLYYTGSGPTWFSFSTEPVCSKHWWENLLYINNFEPTEKQCMGWSWYLSNDMQFFVISPLLLITLWKWPKIGYSVTGIFFLVSFITNFVVTYHYNLIAGLGGLTQSKDIMAYMARFNEFNNKVYVRPYTRISAYLVGIVLAYYLCKRKQANSGKNNWMVLSGGWIISTTVTLICLFGQYHRDMSVLENSFYNAFHRTCFSCGLAWVMFVCLTDQGGVVNSILSCKILVPLSRLTYCAYLVHPMVMLAYFRSVRSLIDVTPISMAMIVLGFLFLSYVAAFVMSLLFESPIIRLEKFVRNRFNKS